MRQKIALVHQWKQFARGIGVKVHVHETATTTYLYFYFQHKTPDAVNLPEEYLQQKSNAGNSSTPQNKSSSSKPSSTVTSGDLEPELAALYGQRPSTSFAQKNPDHGASAPKGIPETWAKSSQIVLMDISLCFLKNVHILCNYSQSIAEVQYDKFML